MDKNFVRLLDTLAILQRNRPLSTKEVKDRLAARGHDVNARTVQRDLENLAAHYPIECDARTKPFAWRWREAAPRISLPSMDWPEAVSFHLIETYLSGVLPPSVSDGIEPYLVEARRKLSQHFDLPIKRWPERVRVVHQGSPQIPPRVLKAVHATFAEAVLLGRRLKVRYRSVKSPEAKEHVVSPLGLVQHGSVFYVPARFGDHTDVRTMALHRVRSAELLPDPSGIEAFDLSEWLGSGALGFGGDQMIDLELKLFGGMAERMLESPLSKNQRVDASDSGAHVLIARVRDTVQLRRWVLSLGDQVEVIAPEDLRKPLRDSLMAAVERYRPQQPELRSTLGA